MNLIRTVIVRTHSSSRLAPVFAPSLAAALAAFLLAPRANGQSRPDFNGDGYADVGVGVPGEDIGSLNNAGALVMMYGGTFGVTAGHAQLLHQNRPGVPENAQAFDEFAGAMAAGDFDGDGFDDVAVGVPGESIGSKARAGGVHVLYGSANFVTTQGNQFWTQNKNGIAGASAAGDHFGEALEAGDFNGDGFDDLVIGVPRERVANIANAGAVHILYGSANGLRVAGSQYLHQNSPGVAGKANSGDRFGSALSAGDFNGDGFEDLVVGVPMENVQTRIDSGAVNVLYGSAAGIATPGNKQWHQTLLGNGNLTEPWDRFGAIMASGDFNDDGFEDLAVGAPGESINGVRDNGAVSVIYGTAGGLAAPDAQFLFLQNPVDSGAMAEQSPRFASALATGDLDGDGFDELVVGVRRYADVDNDNLPAGIIWTLPGSVDGITLAGSGAWFMHQAVDVEPDGQEQFGSALTIADFNNDGFADVLVGVPRLSTGLGGNEGGVVVMMSSSTGLEFQAGEILTQQSFGEFSEGNDQMGRALTR